jgi:hypothetical protein
MTDCAILVIGVGPRHSLLTFRIGVPYAAKADAGLPCCGSAPVKVGHALVWDCLRDVDRFCGNLPKSANICLLDFLAETFGLEIDRSSKLAFWPPSFRTFLSCSNLVPHFFNTHHRRDAAFI